MRLLVDWDRCEANGVCVRVAPQVFRLDETEDRLHLLMEEVPEELHLRVEKAVRGCPRQALSLKE
ncbi:ferredoxin [Chondromyces crocatus]|uniref:Ferredoxin n=1 Tax=Chondromyces crocatus TaxID=52 RepID=A0A0K1EPZ9_CHOCO|nr:ferredoxin [Chondromyces crocatus]AKT42688.1 ferredoxin [Chondromyces crocatus]